MTTRTWIKCIPRAFPLGLAWLVCLVPALAFGSTWNTYQVDNNASDGQFASLAKDGSNNLHMSYYEASGKLRYATGKPGSFTFKTPVTSNVATAGTSLVLDATGAPQISYYYNGGSGNPRGVRNVTGTALTSIADPNGGNFTPVSNDGVASFHKDGTTHLVYAWSGNFYYAKNHTPFNYSVWDTTQLESGSNAGAYNSLVVDGNDHVFVVGYNDSNKDLFMYTNESGSWVGPTAIASAGGTTNSYGRWHALAIDASGKLYLSYLETTSTTQKIKYRTRPAGVGAAWSGATELADAGSTGGATSIAVDGSGAVHVCYYYATATAGKLRYGTNMSGSWSFEDVDATATFVGNYPSMTVDGDLTVDIAYYDASNTALKLAVKKALTASPALAALGTVDRGFQGSATTVTIGNNLPLSQTLGSLGTGFADFVIANDTCSGQTLAASTGTCTVQLSFAPTVSDARSTTYNGSLAVQVVTPYRLGFEAPVQGITSANFLVTAGIADTVSAGGTITPVKVAVAPGGSQIFSVTPAAGFSLVGVQDGTTPLSAPYTLSGIAADHNLVADFTSPIRIQPTGTHFGSLQSAYGVAGANSDWTIQSQQTIPGGGLLVDQDNSVTLSGGYDGSFGSQTGMTAVSGDVTITNGTLAVEGVVLE